MWNRTNSFTGEAAADCANRWESDITVDDDFGSAAPLSACNYPAEVQAVLEFCALHQVPVSISRNLVANGCLDAAGKRTRDGKIGIPLHDELKTLALVCRGAEEHLILCHLPADCRLDLSKVRKLIAAPRRLTWLSSDGCLLRNIGFGRMNPFIGDALHIFDSTLATRMTTMMTNAGDRLWAVEFCPSVLIGAMVRLGIAMVADTIVPTHGDTAPGDVAKPQPNKGVCMSNQQKQCQTPQPSKLRISLKKLEPSQQTVSAKSARLLTCG